MMRKENCSLKGHHTFGMEVKAAQFIEYNTVEELKGLLSDGTLSIMPWIHIGGGSNLLFLSDYLGCVVHSAIKGIEVVQEDEDSISIKVGAGEDWDDLVAYTVSKAWYGMENLSLIPGEVGASAVQNIGAYGIEACDLITAVHTVEVTTGLERIFLTQECNYGYRSSIFKNQLKGAYIVTAVTYKLSKKPIFCLTYGHLEQELIKRERTLTLSNVRDTIIEIRQEKLPDPKAFGNAGSFFMNPVIASEHFKSLQTDYPSIPHFLLATGDVKIPAAWLIEQCGWKGVKRGQAAVHDRQPLVLINCGEATGTEVWELAIQIKESVYKTFGIQITPEVNLIGSLDESNDIR
ncbi:MAG: UDP-N-acetylmuramate dehydrogenase [Phocaeicola sp.]